MICHTDEYHYLAWKVMADILGVPFDRKINDRLRGISRMESLDIILESYNGTLSQTEKEALAEKTNELYRQYLSRMSPADLSDEVRKLDKAMDAIRDKYGADTIMRAGAMAAGRNVGRKHKAQIELKKRLLT